MEGAETHLRSIIEEIRRQAGQAAQLRTRRRSRFCTRSHMDGKPRRLCGLKPLENELAAIDALPDRRELSCVFARLMRRGVSSPVFLWNRQESQEIATQYIASVGRGVALQRPLFGLGAAEPRRLSLRRGEVQGSARGVSPRTSRRTTCLLKNWPRQGGRRRAGCTRDPPAGNRHAPHPVDARR